MTATASDGTTSGPVKVNGTGGAQYYSFYTTNGTTLSTITVDVDTAGAIYNGFAIGEFGIAVDAINPRVTTTVPAAGATGVVPSVTLTATFSEDMDASTTDGDASTINGTTFKLFKKGSTTKVAAAVSYDAATDKATLDPTSSLKRGATYKAVVTTVAEDLTGNHPDQNPTTTGLQQKA